MSENASALLNPEQSQDASLEAQHILSMSEAIINEVSQELAGISFRDRVKEDIKKTLEDPKHELSSATEMDIHLEEAISKHGIPREGFLHLLLNRLEQEDDLADKISTETLTLFREGGEDYKNKVYQDLVQLHPSALNEGKEQSKEIKRIYRFIEKEASKENIPTLVAVDEFYRTLVLMKRFAETRNAVSFMEEANSTADWVTQKESVTDEERAQSLSLATSLVPSLREGDLISIKGLFGVEDDFTVTKNNKVSKVLMTVNEAGEERNFRYRSPGALEGSMSDVLRVTKYSAGRKEAEKIITIPGLQRHIDAAAKTDEAISAAWADKQAQRRAA